MDREAIKEIVYRKVDAKTPPKHWGWYDTDKGNLFWYQMESAWSCNEHRLSEEYPNWWLEEVSAHPIEKEKERKCKCDNLDCEDCYTSTTTHKLCTCSDEKKETMYFKENWCDDCMAYIK